MILVGRGLGGIVHGVPEGFAFANRQDWALLTQLSGKSKVLFGLSDGGMVPFVFVLSDKYQVRYMDAAGKETC